MINVLIVSYWEEKRTQVAINKFGICTTKLALTLSCPDTKQKGQNPGKKNYSSREEGKTSTIKEKMFKARIWKEEFTKERNALDR